jgi:anthranilate synthase component 1
MLTRGWQPFDFGLPPVGYSGVMDTAIAIRTLVVRDRTVHLQVHDATALFSLAFESTRLSQAGGGIVFDSVPSDEYEETMNKLRATMRAVEVRAATALSFVYWQ